MDFVYSPQMNAFHYLIAPSMGTVRTTTDVKMELVVKVKAIALSLAINVLLIFLICALMECVLHHKKIV